MVELSIPNERFKNIFKFCIDNNIDIREGFIFNVKGKEYCISKASAILGSETIFNEFIKN